ncbi:MAG: polyketide cyclase [Opitutia bacterium Tous-C1TDCM]|nr:MAG: polyketide cyclase [Opitutae bacterium Tous-C1TDCM]
MAVFRQERIMPVRPEEVFAAISDPARLARWWGPAGFSNTFETFEFRAGGRWLFTMHGPDGKNYPNESRFLEIVPNALVRIQHTNLPHFELSLALAPEGAGTRLTWVAVFEDAEFAEKLRSFLETANAQNLDRLAQVVGGTA